MILNTAPQNEAVVSNVGQIGEFRIRNSAKAFNILSSGLYANKIKAIIRELSCNAVDAHKAAGNVDKDFDVHLPNSLEPFFYIRDYGTGLSHDQVTNIYTTYFESTKNNSNDYIGALGLGSKSPFSYTDNFTVTAIKDGRKGIYTAFINDSGVPSIALMTETDTTEANGVEIKFSVNERFDFDKFRQEAQNVYRYFERTPNVTGYSGFQVSKPNYESKDIIPGVHAYKDTSTSMALMGNIAYPIQVPNVDTNLGTLKQLLSCGLELHFDIGELDFQASREGLSYIQQTVTAIKSKLEAVNVALTSVLAKEADAIANEWERSIFLFTKKRHALWSNAVALYVQKNKFALFGDSGYWSSHHTIMMDVSDLETKYNLVLSKFTVAKHDRKCRNDGADTERVTDPKNPTNVTWAKTWRIPVVKQTVFIKNDLKVGANERAKHHYRTTWDSTSNTLYVYVLQAADKSKPAKFDEFFKAINNPPEDQITIASKLEEKPRTNSISRNVTILELTEKTRQRGWRDDTVTTWSDAGSLSSFNDKDTYVYAPLSGFSFQSDKTNYTVHELVEYMKNTKILGLCDIRVFGVRKTDIEEIKKKSNWVNIETHIANVLSKVDDQIFLGSVKADLDRHSIMRYNTNSYNKMVDESPLKQLYLKLQKVKSCNNDLGSIRILGSIYCKAAKFDPSVLMATYDKEITEIYKRYPLLRHLASYPTTDAEREIVTYINLIEQLKKGN